LKHYSRAIIKQQPHCKGFSRQGITVSTWYDYRKGGISCMSGTERNSIKLGLRVSIVLKADQRSGKLTEGIVKDILTSSPVHPHGIKVRLITGEIGRVKEIK
jgi:uncharacterized repeat protein (TIGR03833 family)